MTPRHLTWVLLTLLNLVGCDDTPSGPPAEVTRLAQSMVVAYEADDAAFLGIWGPRGDQVWVVGGSTETAGGQILYYDGREFAPEIVPAGPFLWWIHGTDEQHVWAVGERGRILRRTEGGWQDESPSVDEKLVLWGVWAARPTDIWAVGGSVRRNGPKGVVLRSAGDGQWARVQDAAFPTDLNLYKVWGRAQDHVFIVGEGGVTIQYDGSTFKRVDTGVRDLLFTVHGTQDHPTLAVGGANAGQAFRFEAGAWRQEDLGQSPGLNGVFMRTDGVGLAVGNRGAFLYRSVDAHWYNVPLAARGEIGARTLHAVGAFGGIWAVGGDLSNMTNGIILKDGTGNGVTLGE